MAKTYTVPLTADEWDEVFYALEYKVQLIAVDRGSPAHLEEDRE